MRVVFLVMLFLSLSVFSGSAQSDPRSLAGNWLGTLDAGGSKLRLLLKVEKSGDGYTAKMDSIDQGAKDLAIDRIALEGNKVTFSATAYGMSYEGTVDQKSDAIDGTFKQGSAVLPLVFTRTAAPPSISRPQDPVKPYPYNEEEVSYRNTVDNVKLAGTLTLPRDKTARHPAVLLITGSGPQDRNETIAGHRPFLVLADYLTRNGIAVLRVDDRGIGGSDLGNMNATSENFMLDVLAGVEYLKTRQDIDAKKIGLIGHSEGGMIAPMAAARSKDVAFIVMMAGLGQRGDDLIYTQTELIHRASGMDKAATTRVTETLRAVNTIAKTETDAKRAEQEINSTIDRQLAAIADTQQKADFEGLAASLKSRMAMFTSPWYRYFITFDPAPTLGKVKVPVLAINGERDLQVAHKQNLDGIAAALKSAKNKDVTVRSFPHLNHLFQTSMTGLPTEYMTIEETMSPEVMRTISEWIAERTLKKQ